jgi:hypothetical protein
LSATGSMLADFTILKVIKVNFEAELKHLFHFLKLDKLNTKLKVILAILIIGSPLPDEMGVLLLVEHNKLSKIQFLTLCFLANFTFIYTISRFL